MKKLLPLCVFMLLTLISITACEKAAPPEDAQQTQKTEQTEKTEQAKQDEHAGHSHQVPDAMGIHKVEESEHGPVANANIHGTSPQKKKITVVVPENVKGQWTSVVFNLIDKEKGTTEDLTVNLGEKKQIPESNLTIVVGDFLPEFSLLGKERVVTSNSNNPQNPAVGVRILEGQDQLYPEPGKEWGWLYKNFPKMHAFIHERFEVYLKEGVPKK